MYKIMKKRNPILITDLILLVCFLYLIVLIFQRLLALVHVLSIFIIMFFLARYPHNAKRTGREIISYCIQGIRGSLMLESISKVTRDLLVSIAEGLLRLLTAKTSTNRDYR